MTSVGPRPVKKMSSGPVKKTSALESAGPTGPVNILFGDILVNKFHLKSVP